MSSLPSTSFSPASVASSWLVPMGPSGSERTRLVCFPHAGAGASAYRPWLAHLPRSLRLESVQLPGREARLREPLGRDLRVFADEIAPAIASASALPFALFGHSMGALLAYEVALRMRDRGLPQPLALVVSGRRAPHVLPRERPIGLGSDEAFLAGLQQRYGALPAELLRDRELREIYLPILRADVTAVERYAPRAAAALAIPVSAFGGTADLLATPDDLEQWRHCTTASFGARVFHGGHFFVQHECRRVVEAVAGGLDTGATR
jgi:surfactin synthase thioesterase subunit